MAHHRGYFAVPAAHPQDDQWDRIVRDLRNYALRKYGWDPAGLTLHSPYAGGKDHFEPFPPRGPDLPPTPERAAASAFNGRAPSWVRDAAFPDHLPDFQMVYEPSLGVFCFTGKQQAVVRKLWEAREEGTPSVRQKALLDAAASDCARLLDLFRRSPAWGTLIVPGRAPASYTLPPLPAAPEEEEEGRPDPEE